MLKLAPNRKQGAKSRSRSFTGFSSTGSDCAQLSAALLTTSRVRAGSVRRAPP